MKLAGFLGVDGAGENVVGVIVRIAIVSSILSLLYLVLSEAASC